MDWQIVGDFENISASGYDKNYGPLDHPEPEAVFKNKIAADVHWFDLYKQVPGRWIDFTNNFYCNNTLVYAQTFCNTPVDRFVQLRIGTSGSLKVWVNDQLLFSEVEECNNGIDNYIVPVKLTKGNNRILLQIGCSKITQCNFMMRATDQVGNLVSDLPFTSVYSPYQKTIQEVSSLVKMPFELYLLKQINNDPDKLVNYLVLANTYLTNDKVHDARKILLKAQEIAPNCSFVLYQLYELYSRNQDRTSASLMLEKLKRVDPENPIVLNIKINEAFDAKNFKEARQLIDKKEQLYGVNEDLFFSKLSLANNENNVNEYEVALKQIYTLYSHDYYAINQKFLFEKNYKQDQKAALKVLKDFTKNYFVKDAEQSYSNELFSSGQVKEGLSILEKLRDFYPFNDSYYQQLGLFYLQTGNLQLAKQNFEECLRIAPYYGPYHGNYAKIFVELGEKEKAIEEYNANVIYRPDDYEAIRKLRELQSKKEVFEYFPQKDYYSIFENSPSASDYPSDNFISITDETQVVLHEYGGCEIRHVMMFKALTLKGIDNLKEYTIGYSSNENLTIEKAEVLKKNGNRLQAEVNENQIVYTSLEPGDAVFLIYKKIRNINGQMSKNFSDKSMLNLWYPALNIEYSLLAHKNVPFKYVVDKSDIQPEITNLGEFDLYCWKSTKDGKLKIESYMPVKIDAGPLLSISTIPDWDYISKWYYDISNTKTKPEFEVMETVNTLLSGKTGLTEMEKAEIIYNFIEQNIRYSSVSFRQNGIVPQKATDVLLTRIGDCKDLSVLFTSMCNAAGIKAEIVLVIRRQNGQNWMSLPSFEFDHAIAKAYLDGKEYYIELTSGYYPFAALGEGLIGAVVLDVNNDPAVKMVSKILSPETRKPNNYNREARVTFAGDSMTYSSSAFCTGTLAANKRARYRDLGKEDRNTDFLKSITNSYSNIKLLGLDFSSSLSDCSDTLGYTFSYSAPKVFSKINNISIVKLPLIEALLPMDFLSPEERAFPIEAWKYSSCDTITEKLTIVVPENKKLVEVPKSEYFSCNQADYSLVFSFTNSNELSVTRTMVYKKDFVPVADYTSYRSFIEAVVNADTQQIGFK